MKNKKALSLILSYLAISLNFILVSCAETKVSQCQKIILITQKIVQESQNNRQTKDIKQALKFADVFEEAGQKMKQLKIEDEQLAKYQLGFAEIYQGNADTTRQFVSALNNKDISTARLMKQQVQQLGKKEQELGNQMNTYCQK
ncbi:hypothetical protein [Aphanothece sacrum]|uniref:Lipoprotein n=1 Tax=Aphanothece sacrum FPU1 TaxID=1920663 RepID=A0A401IMH6_APHSA|nr:hypothetical protein [Aphanothece sacrum]GBF82428.1 hypothetical protein AsFPU1_3857 [Aphanothece sacrum FPU1]GBF84417.1 hypothetical protein AsFPU3_1466 [Aphanothece sacrum FPU3]